MSKDANSFGHDKALAWESRGFVYTKKRMHRFDTPSLFLTLCLNCEKSPLPDGKFAVGQR